MKFSQVAIVGLAHVDAPIRLETSEINERLQQTTRRIGVSTNVLEDVAGIRARHLWTPGTTASEGATQSGRLALEDAQIDAARLGLLINTSVSRDFLEPSTASIVAGNLGVAGHCMNFDIANACLAFINGMDMAAMMIEQGHIDHALVVDCETAETVYEKTIDRLMSEDCTEQDYRDELAALTLGSGAAAMVLCRADLAPGAMRYLGGTTRSATQFNNLCRGNLDRMRTDTKALLIEGMRLAQETFEMAREDVNWQVAQFDEFAIHQVSRVHTQAIIAALGIDPTKVMTIFPEHGNVGPASIPIVLSKLRQEGRMAPGKRVGLMGIGSGLNCTVAEIAC